MFSSIGLLITLYFITKEGYVTKLINNNIKEQFKNSTKINIKSKKFKKSKKPKINIRYEKFKNPNDKIKNDIFSLDNTKFITEFKERKMSKDNILPFNEFDNYDKILDDYKHSKAKIKTLQNKYNKGLYNIDYYNTKINKS